MRNSSRQKLSKVHEMLDKQLQDVNEPVEQQFKSFHQRRKPRSDFQHLRISNNIKIDNEEVFEIKQIKKQNKQKNEGIQQRPHVPSLFKRSLQKNQKYKKQLSSSKRTHKLTESSESESEVKQNKASTMRNSRKSEINELQKKLMNLEKKMENIQISSSSNSDDEQYEEIQKNKQSTNRSIRFKINQDNSKEKKRPITIFTENYQKKSLNSLMLKQNQIAHNNNFNDYNKPKITNDGTARFPNNQHEQIIQKSSFQCDLPLSHRQNYHDESEQQDSNSDDLNFKYEKFTKINKISQQKRKIPELSNQSNLPDKKENKETSNQRTKNFQNKQITQKIQKNSKSDHNQPLLQPKIQISKQQDKIDSVYKDVKDKQKINEKKSHTEHNQNDTERKMTVEYQILPPKFKIENIKQKSKQKKNSSSKAGSQNNLNSNSNKNKSLSKKSLNSKQKRPIINKPTRLNTNLDNSFRSDKSVKSKKSVNSVASNSSIKSFSRYQVQNGSNSIMLLQKKWAKKIQNLEKQLEHYKRLSRRYENEISEYKLLQIQYKKLQTQFKKSQQIRFEQKKIIQNFRNRTFNM